MDALKGKAYVLSIPAVFPSLRSDRKGSVRRSVAKTVSDDVECAVVVEENDHFRITVDKARS